MESRILTVLEESLEPLSAEEIYKHFPKETFFLDLTKTLKKMFRDHKIGLKEDRYFFRGKIVRRITFNNSVYLLFLIGDYLKVVPTTGLEKECILEDSFTFEKFLIDYYEKELLIKKFWITSVHLTLEFVDEDCETHSWHIPKEDIIQEYNNNVLEHCDYFILLERLSNRDTNLERLKYLLILSVLDFGIEIEGFEYSIDRGKETIEATVPKDCLKSFTFDIVIDIEQRVKNQLNRFYKQFGHLTEEELRQVIYER